MARLRDIGHVWKNVGPWTFLKRVYNQMWNDNLLVWAAALAYSWLFALFPFLIFCISLLPLLPEEIGSVRLKPRAEEVQQFIDAALVTGEDPAEAVEQAAQDDPERLRGLVEIPYAPTVAEAAATTQPADVKPEEPGVQPAPITSTISEIVDTILNQPNPSLATLSILVALFTASGGMSMTMAGLDQCYDVRPERMRPLYRARPVAMLLTVIVAAMVLAVLILIPVTDAFLAYAARYEVGGYELVPFLWLINPLRYALGLLLLFGVLALVYRFGPSLTTRMHLFSPGSAFCVIMWLLTAWAFRIYLDYFGAAENYQKTYGAVAGVAVLMLLFYLDALFLLIGAEINSEIDFIKLGIRSGPLPEEQEIAPVPTYQLDEEDRELKAEIEERRSVDAVPPEQGSLGGEGAGI